MKQLSILFCIPFMACHTPAPTTVNSGTNETAKVEKVNSDIKSIEFRTGSRGYNRQILFTKDSVKLVINSMRDEDPSRNTTTALKSEEWNKLIAALEGVDVHQLDKLKSPTMQRAVDAADGSTLTVTTNKESSHNFDNLDPDQHLKKVLEVVLEIEKDRKK
jgi:hypothetical protein